ncbi:MAG: hypothetical protein QOH12_1398 [Solirubrobacteraceae bacterium]|nr:hypothetical protein [Solirubrobacteraceae bacterium]
MACHQHPSKRRMPRRGSRDHPTRAVPAPLAVPSTTTPPSSGVASDDRILRRRSVGRHDRFGDSPALSGRPAARRLRVRPYASAEVVSPRVRHPDEKQACPWTQYRLLRRFCLCGSPQVAVMGPPGYRGPPGAGMASWRHTALAVPTGISRWRGTGARRSPGALTQIAWFAPSRRTSQPCSRR